MLCTIMRESAREKQGVLGSVSMGEEREHSFRDRLVFPGPKL